MTSHEPSRRSARFAADIGARRRSAATLAVAAVLASLTLPLAEATADAQRTQQRDSGQRAADGQQAGRTQALGMEQRARGTLLSVERTRHYTRAQVDKAMSGNKVDAPAARYGATSYRLTYATITPQGAPTTASALLMLPDGGAGRLDAVSETHGTLAYRGYAPSYGDDLSALGSLLYASGGRAAVAPDYLGLGAGPGHHPYVDTRSSVSASLDALRAARTAVARQGKQLTGDVYATGFSQGGQVAMALARELSRGADPRFRLRALAPVAGPYDIEGEELPGMFDGRIDGASASYYLSYFLTAQNRLHPLYAHPRDVFRAPYADRVEQLFDGDHKDDEIVTQLPDNIKELLTPKWYDRMQRPTGTLAKVIRLNDGVCEWGPRVPVRLHTSDGDRDVPLGNTVSCAKDLAAHGSSGKVVNHGKADHGGTYRKAVAGNARWFAGMR